MTAFRVLVGGGLILLYVGVGCQSLPLAEEEPFNSERLEQMDRAVGEAIEAEELPGGVLWLEHRGSSYRQAYGNRAVEPAEEAMTRDTVFDLASLTKVVATTPAVMRLWEEGKIRLDAPLATYLPEFDGPRKETVTVRHLLTHTSGLPPGISLSSEWSGYEAGIQRALAAPIHDRPGSAFDYSDVNFILLGELVRRVSGRPLDEYVEVTFFEPLRMSQTGFAPPRSKRHRIAPTELVDGDYLRGVVHDPTARRMGGVAGHAGLFSSARDLARYSRMLLNQGNLDGVRVLQPETVQTMTRIQTQEGIGSKRGLGWDIDSPYQVRGAHFPLGSYGHTGWTGGSMWIDPYSNTFVIFLCHRIHPDGEGNVVPLRRELSSLAAQAVEGVDFSRVSLPTALRPGPRSSSTGMPGDPTTSRTDRAVLNGIDVLIRNDFRTLQGKRVGLITNHTGRDRTRKSTIDWLHEAKGVDLRALFSPEHGIRGDHEAKVSDSRDPQTGLPIYSLYGEDRHPRPLELKGLDTLVFDIQDIGCRFYTYIATMGLAMEAAAEAGLGFVVLDRVNPIGGTCVEGPVSSGPREFTNFHSIPVRHGMTVGELARLFNEEKGIGVDLTIVPVKGWDRGGLFYETGLPWINPSPNMRNVKEAILYPGIGLLETTNLSVGRGTDTPFEVIGAPYIDDRALSRELNGTNFEGVEFVPIRFTPEVSVFAGESCQGVYMLLTDPETCSTVALGITIAKALHELYPETFELGKMNRLMAHSETVEAIRSGQPVSTIRERWEAEMRAFRPRRDRFLLY